MLPKIELERIHYKKEIKIAIRFSYNQGLIEEIKKIENSKWSYSQKAWLLPYSKEKLNELKNLLSGKVIFRCAELGKVSVDEEKLNFEAPFNSPHEEAEGIFLKSPLPQLCNTKQEKINQFKYWLKSKRYSENTIKTYLDALTSFLRFHHEKEINQLTNNDLIDYNNNYILKNKYSSSYQNQVVNALKLYFKTVENIKMDVELIHRPKTQKLLPNVFSKSEIKRILDSPLNIKHKAMLSLIYGCGLRSGEMILLKLEHIDSNRKLVLVKQSKGRKDRIVPLSDKLLQLLRDYYKIYKPKTFLFEGQNSGENYSSRSLQNVLKQCMTRAGIKKPGTLHWLRHSYATHLLENGTDIRFIQELLGHNSTKTTEIYTHVSTKSIQQIKSPFDDL